MNKINKLTADQVARPGPKPVELRVRLQAGYDIVEKTGCWIWRGATRNGYGSLHVRAEDGKWRMGYAHRIMFEQIKGKIPDDLQLDHLCRNTRCVNPEHLEAVTPLVNVRRGLAGQVIAARNLSKEFCPRGHIYSGYNLIIKPNGKRQCRKCTVRTTRIWRARKHLKMDQHNAE